LRLIITGEVTAMPTSHGSSIQINSGEKAEEKNGQHHDQNPKPFVWSAKAQDIIAKYRRAKAVLDKLQTARDTTS
jgi:hypothetical protein